MSATKEMRDMVAHPDDVMAGEAQLGSRATRTPRWLLAVVAALVLAAGVLGYANHRHDQVAAEASEALSVGKTHVEELLSYDFRNIDDEFEEERGWLTEGFAEEYTPLISEAFAPDAKKAKLLTRARVVAAGVDEFEKDRAELLLFVNIGVDRKGSAQTVSGSRLRVVLDRVDGTWLISAMDPI